MRMVECIDGPRATVAPVYQLVCASVGSRREVTGRELLREEPVEGLSDEGIDGWLPAPLGEVE